MYLNDPLDVSIVWEARLLGVIRFLKSNGSYDKRQNNMLVEFKLDGKTSTVWMKYTLAEPAEPKTGEEIIREVESVDDPVWELTTF